MISKKLAQGVGIEAGAWVNKQEARKGQARTDKTLDSAQMRALGDYMQPAKHVRKGQAPGLGFAV